MHERVVCLGCGGTFDDGQQPISPDDEPCGCPPVHAGPTTLDCPQCGGALRAGVHVCGFCAATVATARCANCLCWNLSGEKYCGGCSRSLWTMADGQAYADLKCPCCGDQLQQRSYGEAELDECDGCSGVFLEAAMMDRLVVSQVAGPKGLRLALPQSKTDSASPSEARDPLYLKCPVCQQLMNRCNFGRISGVVVDVCRGHGVWFDPGEISEVLHFVQRGGLSEPGAVQPGFAFLDDWSLKASPQDESAGSLIDRLERYELVPAMVAGVLAQLWEPLKRG